MRGDGDVLTTLIPCWTTCWGSWDCACVWRIWVRIWSVVGTVLLAKMTLSCDCPELEFREYMYCMLSTPLTCCSIGVATACFTVTASAPG